MVGHRGLPQLYTFHYGRFIMISHRILPRSIMIAPIVVFQNSVRSIMVVHDGRSRSRFKKMEIYMKFIVFTIFTPMADRGARITPRVQIGWAVQPITSVGQTDILLKFPID